MATAQAPMTINDEHEPGDAEEQVLNVFKQERKHFGESRMSPQLIRRRFKDNGVDASKQNVNYALTKLVSAGWVEKIADGLYEFVEDPREADDA